MGVTLPEWEAGLAFMTSSAVRSHDQAHGQGTAERYNNALVYLHATNLGVPTIRTCCHVVVMETWP